MQENELAEMPNQVLAENSIHSIPQSTIFTQNQQQNAQKKKGTKIKNKKTVCFLLVALFAITYYIFIKSIKPEEAIKQEVKFEQAEIQFDTSLGQKTAWIKQKLDHFDSTQKRVWKQRLVVDLDISQMKMSTPIFLNVPPLTKAQVANSYVNIREITTNLKGAFICLQPRYFGESKPFGDDSYLTKNLKYLTIQQIIEDTAYAIDRIVSNNFFKITKQNPWIITGDSYSGMIVVWLRAKYPQLTFGAYVSSPIIPTTLIPQISQKLHSNILSGGKKCKSTFMRIVSQFEEKAYAPKSDGLLLDIGRGLEMTAQQAMQLIMDKIRTFKRQNFIALCVSNTEQELLKGLIKLLYYEDRQGIDPICYSKTELKSSDSWEQFEIVRRKRAFQWLRCSQIGLFQVSAALDKKSLNFKQLNQNYFRGRCKEIFGEEIWPNPKALIEKYSNQTSSLKNLIIVNGAYDIWLPYIFSHKNSSTVSSLTIKCEYCEHNFDIMANNILQTDLNQLRMKEKAILSSWLQKIKK